MFYKNVEFQNLTAVQDECCKVMSNIIDISSNVFMWPKDSSILNLDVLQREISALGINQHIFGAAFSVTVNKESDIHIDHSYSGWRYSLNIPILNTDNTYVTFYDASRADALHTVRTDSTGVSTGSGSYTRFDKHQCTEIGRFETNSPAIIDTSVPHQFESYTTLPRVMLLIRLKDTFTNDTMEKL